VVGVGGGGKKKKKGPPPATKQRSLSTHLPCRGAAMGVYLSQPCKVVDAEEGAGNGLRYAAGEMQVNAT
jgi:hypothetical protein